MHAILAALVKSEWNVGTSFVQSESAEMGNSRDIIINLGLLHERASFASGLGVGSCERWFFFWQD